MPAVRVFEHCADLHKGAADFLLQQYQHATDAGRDFTLALSGGSTPKGLYELLATPAYLERMDWSRIQVFFGDERAVGPDHAWSNFRMAREALLEKVPLPETNLHRIQGELGAEAAAAAYDETLRQAFPGQDIPAIDLNLLGMGTDGHTASLFPGTDALHASGLTAPVLLPTDTTIDPAVDRVTLTFPVLNASRTALFLVCGASKRDVASQAITGDELPAGRVAAPTTWWFLDRDACGNTGLC